MHVYDLLKISFSHCISSRRNTDPDDSWFRTRCCQSGIFWWSTLDDMISPMAILPSYVLLPVTKDPGLEHWIVSDDLSRSTPPLEERLDTIPGWCLRLLSWYFYPRLYDAIGNLPLLSLMVRFSSFRPHFLFHKGFFNSSSRNSNVPIQTFRWIHWSYYWYYFEVQRWVAITS